MSVVSIEVRKYSYLRSDSGLRDVPLGSVQQYLSNSTNNNSDDWIHLPYRSDISIHFIRLPYSNVNVQSPNCKIKLVWKSSVLEELNLIEMTSQFDQVPILAICKTPVVGFKYLLRKGQSLIICRFQISFKTDSEYQDCVRMLKQYEVPMRAHGALETRLSQQQTPFVAPFMPTQMSFVDEGSAHIVPWQDTQIQNSITTWNKELDSISFAIEPQLSVPPQFTGSGDVDYLTLSDAELQSVLKTHLSDENFIRLLGRVSKLI